MQDGLLLPDKVPDRRLEGSQAEVSRVDLGGTGCGVDTLLFVEGAKKE